MPLLPSPLRRVAVFRALVLGDLLCATPALRALRAGLPGARISLVGLPWARELVARLDSVDDFIEFPGWPGLPERTPVDAHAVPAFLAGMRDAQFDLALQLHGSGAVVNPLVAAFGARHSAGFAAPGAWRDPADAALYAPWPEHGSEVERLLALTDHLQLPRRGEALDFPLCAADREAAARLLEPLRGRRFAIVHAGAQLPSRRWPAARFAQVADVLHAESLAIVLTGTAGERALATAVADAMHAPVLDLLGRTDLWTLGALVERAVLVVCNDTGLSHVAAALATPSVVVASGSDVARWRPHDAARHRVLWHDVACRPCAEPVCSRGHVCALGVSVDAVCDAARQAVRLRNAA